MKVWLIDSSRRYNNLLFHLFYELAAAGDPRVEEFKRYSADEVLPRLENLFFEEENSLHITLIVDGSEVDFLTALYQVIIRSPYQQSNFRVVIFSTLSSWTETYPKTSPTDLGKYFLSRKPSRGGTAAFKMENCYSQLEATHKIRANLILLGLLYGGDGLDFKPVLRQIWEGSYPSGFATQLADRVVPSIHYQRFLQVISSLLLGNHQSYGFIVPAYDWESRPLSLILQQLNLSINYSSPSTDSNSPTQPSEATISEEPSAVWKMDFTHFFRSIRSEGVSGGEIETRFPSDWTSFQELSGLKPVNLLVAGPPKAGKTTLAKELSEKLQLAYVDIPSSVIALLKYDPATTVLPSYLDGEKVLSSQQELKSFLEVKLQEGKKPGKDKNASSEPPPIDYSLITESLCLSIPVESVRLAVGFVLASNGRASRRGTVLDVWENPSLFDTLQAEALSPLVRSLSFPQPEEGEESQGKSLPSAILLDIVVELSATEKLILDKQTEIIGPANMKSKESQVTIKALEGSLSSYFSLLVPLNGPPDGEGGPSLKTHPKLLSSDSLVVRWDCFPASESLSSSTRELVAALQEKRGGRGFGWLCSERSSSSSAAVSPDAAAIEGEETILDQQQQIEEKQGDVSSPEKEEEGEGEAKIWSDSSEGVRKIDDFLTATVLPVLAKSMIEVVRQQPEDPILYVAQYLAAVSQAQQREAYEYAKKQFEELLQS